MERRKRVIEEHDVVRFLEPIQSWPAGTKGTVVAMHPKALMVEISDEQGAALDFVWAPDALLKVTWSQALQATV